MPDLDQRRAAAHRVHPADLAGERMVDRQQAPARLGGVQPVVGFPAEVDPAEVAERSRMPPVGRHLLPGDQGDPVPPRRGGQLGVMADGVVVGDGEELQASFDRQHGQLGDGQHAVGVHGVGVQVTWPPAQARAGRQHPSRRPFRCRRRYRSTMRPNGPGRVPRRQRFCGQLVRHSVRRDAVHADHHLPRSGFDRTWQIAGRGGVAGDDEGLAGTARPAAEPVRPQAAEVEHRPGRALVGQLDAQPGRPRRHLHRQVVPRGGEPVLQRPPSGVPGGARHRRPPFLALAPDIPRARRLSAAARARARPGRRGRRAASRSPPAGSPARRSR